MCADFDKIRVLFIGNHLSNKVGTQSVSQSIAAKLESEGYSCLLSSQKKNIVLRILDIVFSILFKKYDILHVDVFSGNAFNIAVISAAVNRVRKKPLIFTLHGGKLPEFTDTHNERAIGTLKKADIIATPSNLLKEYFSAYTIDIEYIPNPIDLSLFSFKEEKVNVLPPKLLWVRAFTEIYDPFLAIDTLREVKKEYPQATMTMVGPDKGLESKVRAHIKDLGLENDIRITGPVKNRLLPEYYYSHSVYLNTTHYESFGVAVVEAAACGIPVVSVEVGEIPFIWKDNINMQITDRSALAMADRIMKLLSDREIYNSQRFAARRKAEDFTWQNVKPHWKKMFNELNKKNALS